MVTATLFSSQAKCTRPFFPAGAAKFSLFSNSGALLLCATKTRMQRYRLPLVHKTGMKNFTDTSRPNKKRLIRNTGHKNRVIGMAELGANYKSNYNPATPFFVPPPPP
ncbi:hypothetical protein [Taibaiella chishuiensis]|nr:hypothetical protein [Taibaiella chishuiensis]